MDKISNDEFACKQKYHPPLPAVDLRGKVVVVVGANTGLGFEAAKHFASMNPAKLIMTARDPVKGEEALTKLVSETGFHRAELGIVDLSSFSSVRNFSDKLLAENERIDLLIENAGMIAVSKEYTSDGWESSIQVNNLSPELLAILLLPKMLETAKKFPTVPRIVVTTSGTHYLTDFPKEAIESPNIHQKLSDNDFCTPAILAKRYFLSKMLNIFFVRALTARLSEPILVNLANPGLCYSDLTRNVPKTEAMEKRLKDFAMTTEEGSRHIVYNAVAELEGEQLRGAYISYSKLDEPSDVVCGEEGKKIQDRLWDEMIVILNDVDPRVGEIANKYLS
ncbi:hypothetical protein C8J56DRAFT_1166630 [Mycena floridula]|nr:hypothetical protein C8J56DRAFT_1166630 [Mycena floridula]